MPTIAEIRQQYPQYEDMSDDQLATALRNKFYSDMPEEEFRQKVGLGEKPYTSRILPFSKDAQGNVSFDSNAGILGVIKQGLTPFNADTLAADPQTGEVHVNPEFVDRAQILAETVMPIPPMARTIRRAHVTPPTSEELLKVGDAGYDRVREMAVDYRAEPVRELARATRAKLERDGITQRQAKKTFEILDLLEGDSYPIATLQGLDAARRELLVIAKNNKPGKGADRMAAVTLAKGLENFIQKPDPRTLMADSSGTAVVHAGVRAPDQPADPVALAQAQEAARIQAEANANYAAGKRSQNLQGVDEWAQLRSASTNSGLNYQNKLQQQAADILDPKHKERRAGFNETELAALRQVAEGTAPQKVARWFANYLGGGGGLGANIPSIAGATAGAVIAGPAGAAIGAAAPVATGLALKTGVNRSIGKSFGAVDEMVRSRSPLYERMLAEAPMVAPRDLEQAALLRAAMLAYEANNRR